MKVNFRIPSGTKVRGVRAWIARKAVRRLSATTRRLRVDMRGMGPRRVHVVIVIKVAGGERIRDVRVYRTCPSRRLR